MVCKGSKIKLAKYIVPIIQNENVFLKNNTEFFQKIQKTLYQ